MRLFNRGGLDKKLAVTSRIARRQLMLKIVGLARKGQRIARMTAPNRTGALKSNIVLRQYPSRVMASVVSKNTIGKGFYGDKGRSSKSFSLPRYFAMGGRSVSGKSRYMRHTLNELRKSAKGFTFRLR